MFKYLLSLYLNYCLSFTVLKSYASNKIFLRRLGKKIKHSSLIFFFTACNIKSFWLCMTTELLVRKISKSLNSSLKETFKLYASKYHSVLDTSKHEAKISVTWMKAKKTGPFTQQIDYVLHWIGLILNVQYAYSTVLTFIL